MYRLPTLASAVWVAKFVPSPLGLRPPLLEADAVPPAHFSQQSHTLPGGPHWPGQDGSFWRRAPKSGSWGCCQAGTWAQTQALGSESLGPLPSKLRTPISRSSSLALGPARLCSFVWGSDHKVALVPQPSPSQAGRATRAAENIPAFGRVFPGRVVEFLTQPSAAKGYSDSGMPLLKMVIPE